MTPLEEEVADAFRSFWTTGGLDEDWQRWPDHLTEDVHYVERVFGTMRGRDAVRAWITSLMQQRGEVHAVLEWWLVRDHRVVLSMQNRYYSPQPGEPHIDFAGLTVLQYAGAGLFGYEEDYWDVAGARRAHEQFTAAVERCGGPGLDNGRYERLEAERREQTLRILAAG